MNEIKTWEDFWEREKDSLYLQNLKVFLNAQDPLTTYPPRDKIFNAFKLTPLEDVKVVIIGQDPYHQPGQAMGLAFSVPSNVPLPPSLRNIFIEMADDVGGPVRTDGDLTYLAKQGVFLINTILTVERSKPLSHNIPEYKTLIVKVLEELNKRPQPIVFILWGSYARSFKKYINGPNKLVVESNHPSPLSANRGGFFGTRPFSRANNFLAKHGSNVINW